MDWKEPIMWISISFPRDENANILSSLKIKNDPFFSVRQNFGQINVSSVLPIFEKGANDIWNTYKSVVETVIVDNSYLSVWSLRTLFHMWMENWNRSCSHRIQWILLILTLDEGIALSKFHAAIIGFDETGQEALRFLYEYGQFVYPEEMGDNNFICDIFDSSLPEIERAFCY